jgi:hypothetical protein
LSGNQKELVKESNMEKTHTQFKLHSTSGDAAVSGLFGGLLGGAAMAVVIAGCSLVSGHGLTYLGYFSPVTPPMPLWGLLMHLAVSSIYGMLYGLIHRWVGLGRRQRVPGWLAGLVYALALWAFAVTVLLPSTRSVMLTMPWLIFFSGHVAYGLVLGARQKA